MYPYHPLALVISYMRWDYHPKSLNIKHDSKIQMKLRSKKQAYLSRMRLVFVQTTMGELLGGKSNYAVMTTGARFSLNMISAISPRGHLRFMVTKDRVNADVFIDFLKRLVYRAERPIYLIVNGHPTHKAKKVKQYIESINGMQTLYSY